MSNFKQNFNFTTNLILVFILVFGSIVWADTNGVWHRAEDVQPGIFGSDEAFVSDFFIFNNTVRFFKLAQFYDNVEINSNLNVTGNLSVNKICFGSDCKTAWPTASVPTPPTCNGNDGLQWNGTNWSCQTFAAGCTNECSFLNQKSCSGSNVITCGNYDTDSCLEYGGASACTNGCSGGACVICNTQNSYSCYNGNVYWYDSCNNREGVKQSCSNGCSGNTCTTCTNNAYTSCYSGNMYWYDSCSNRGSQQSACTYGCTTGTSSCSAPAPCSAQKWIPTHLWSFCREQDPNTGVNVPALSSGGTYTYACSQFNIPSCFYGTRTSTLICDNGVLSPGDSATRGSDCAAGITCGPGIYSQSGWPPMYDGNVQTPVPYAPTGIQVLAADNTNPWHPGSFYSTIGISNCNKTSVADVGGNIVFNSLPEGTQGETITVSCDSYTKMTTTNTAKTFCGLTTPVQLTGTVTFKCNSYTYYGGRHQGIWDVTASNCAKR